MVKKLELNSLRLENADGYPCYEIFHPTLSKKRWDLFICGYSWG